MGACQGYLAVLVWTFTIQYLTAKGKLDLKFINFRGNGRDVSGSCCDLVCSNPCDPYFRFCIGQNNDCSFFVRQSGVFHEQNNINFGSSISGLANPIVIKRNTIPSSFSIRVAVRDRDPSNDNDLMGDIWFTYTVEKASPNGTKGNDSFVVFGDGRTKMKVNVRVYCDVYYYGDLCDVYCKDNDGGHYTCNSTTGDIICNEGWTGDTCNEDINECRLNVSCPNGTTCTDEELDCSGCYSNNVCHHDVANCSSIDSAISCSGCYLGGECLDGKNCTEVLEELDCDACFVNGSCQNVTSCPDSDCDGCSVAGVCYNGTNCTDIERTSICDGCLVTGVCHNGTTCSDIDWEPECSSCDIETVCQFGGICTNLIGGFNCTCKDGFEGKTCNETAHECVINPCLNGGSCTGNETSYICDCLPWRGGDICEDWVDTCDEEVCFNNATCISNNDTLPGFTCLCESGWGGPTCLYLYGDSYTIRLLGELNNSSRQDLVDGLANLIIELGGVDGNVYVNVDTNSSTIDGDIVTTVVYQVAGEKGPINGSVSDSIFEDYTEDRINTYLPIPLYISTETATQSEQTWISDNWYFLVIGLIIALVLVVILVFVLYLTRNRWNRKVIFVRSESTVSEVSKSGTIAVENPLYRRHESVRNDDIIDQDDITFSVDQTLQARPLPTPGDLDPVYSEASHYETPVKQPVNGDAQCEIDFGALDTRCEAGSNPYTDFNNLDGAAVECPYSELDEITAQKVANVVGLPEDLEDNKTDEQSDDNEDDIDKIKASFKEWHSEA